MPLLCAKNCRAIVPISYAADRHVSAELGLAAANEVAAPGWLGRLGCGPGSRGRWRSGAAGGEQQNGEGQDAAHHVALPPACWTGKAASATGPRLPPCS